MKMGRTLDEVIASLPVEEQAAIEARYQDMKQEVEGFANYARLLRRFRKKSHGRWLTGDHKKL
jgi:hypothetical protein